MVQSTNQAPYPAAGRDAVLVRGVRTPFLKSNGGFADLMSHDLGRMAVASLLRHAGLSAEEVELVVMGSVIQDPRTSNVAREIALGAGIPQATPAFTTTLACISANVAATTVADQIRLGQIDVGIAGGTESFSDPPIRISKALRKALLKLQKAKGPKDWFEILRTLAPRDIALDIPSAAEFSTGLTMGQSCERLAKAWDVSRRDADEFAVRSHVLAHRAMQEGRYAQSVLPLQVPPAFSTITQDDGPRGDSTLEGLAQLRPAFDRAFGVSTAGSSSFFTDGASAVLLMSANKAQQLELAPLATLRDYLYAAGDPLEELLLGPALTIPRLLTRNGLTTTDIGVWEIHEAFAAQVVANLRAMRSTRFARDRLGLDEAPPEIPLERVNAWGGSLSLGHPFGATGGRLLTTAAERLRGTGERFAVVAGCAAGGQGNAILLENPQHHD